MRKIGTYLDSEMTGLFYLCQSPTQWDGKMTNPNEVQFLTATVIPQDPIAQNSTTGSDVTTHSLMVQINENTTPLVK